MKKSPKKKKSVDPFSHVLEVPMYARYQEPYEKVHNSSFCTSSVYFLEGFSKFRKDQEPGCKFFSFNFRNLILFYCQNESNPKKNGKVYWNGWIISCPQLSFRDSFWLIISQRLKIIWNFPIKVLGSYKFLSQKMIKWLLMNYFGPPNTCFTICRTRRSLHH